MTTIKHRAGRHPLVGAFVVGLVALGAVLGLAIAPAQANGLGSATATPSTKLQSGQSIAVSIAGFPAGATVGGVQCDTRVVTAGDQGYCNTTNAVVLTTGPDGKASGTFTVTSGSAFVSANKKGICDDKHSCYLAFATVGLPQETDAVALLQFVAGSVATPTPGAKSASTTNAGPAHRTIKAKKQLKLTVHVRWTGVPTGAVTLSQGKHKLATKKLPASGKVVFSRKLSRGKHKLTIRYSGDATHSASSDSVIVKVKR